MHFHRLIVAAALCAVLAGVAMAQVQAPTRVTTYDWQCQDANGARISDHQREGIATVACLNAPNGAYVQGGRYRITREATPEPVRSAALSWTPPTQNVDGTAIANLAGYRVVYGTSAAALTSTIQLPDPGTRVFLIKDLAPGTYYFGIKAYNTGGKESAVSNVVSRVIL